MPKVSVIVPVYGVEKYIERCARSLLAQTLDDIEFIFIDDCSPDKSIEILREVVNEFPIRINQVRIERMPKNSGLAAVRKYGVSLALGDYIIACDSDDFMDTHMYEAMYNEAVRNELDLVQCDIDLVDDSGVIRTLTSPIDAPSSQVLKDMIIDGNIAASLCNKLVKRTIYQSEGVTFPVAGMDEDNTMSCQLAYYSGKLGYIKQSYYKAYSNMESMSRIPGKEQVLKRYKEALDNSKIAIDFLILHGYNSNSIAVIRAKMRPKITLWPLTYDKECYSIWKETYSETNTHILCDGRIPMKIKIKFFLALTRLVKLIR